MGFSKKHQKVEAAKDSEAKKWVIAGISLRSPLKPIATKPREDCTAEDECGGGSTTPTARESRIPEKFSCPPAPRKRRPASTCHHLTGAIEFFIPPDLESVFMCHAERAN